MKKLLQKLIKYLAYLGAALVIVLAVAVGIFRLMLPRLPEYQEEIKAWASTAIGMQVNFSAMSARWRLSGPELNFFDAELANPGATESILAADEVVSSCHLWRQLICRLRAEMNDMVTNVHPRSAGRFGQRRCCVSGGSAARYKYRQT